MWVHGRSDLLRWNVIGKANIVKTRATLKYITVQQMSKKEVPHRPSTSALYTDFILEAKKKLQHCDLIKYQDDLNTQMLCGIPAALFNMNQPPKFKQT
ncbi:unnamed protein product [Acanthoscelides obtectus]|uniref:Uncharacterized protein n=1 Tax=Acanthoscelides obtectus TaxID=200917 RepID=A0A9P0QJF2_ACAOB|nr:unnamed protein product [Acanthoscelides obtectus]CAK1685937.1 hypothetical protein AOBTE_LOCUS35729 [Acanthoscelides obtectus]